MANQSEPVSAITLRQDTVAPIEGGQLESAGHVIVQLLHKAAGAAEENSQRVLETAQELSTQLHAAQNRIAELEAEVQFYREKSERAQEWLRKISTEIEDRLINQPQEQRRQSSWDLSIH
jgi:molecular chaperone GrpE (heat shock protein)